MPNIPKKRGGARPGAGRHSNAQKGLQTIAKMTVGLTESQMAQVRGLAVDRSASPSEVVRDMVAFCLDYTERRLARAAKREMK